ncbi:MAG: class II fructose-bisphosphate aldolase [Spirochaetales bacterium]|nr:class II fructose-bisphosphate aldolase [Spirochaetales bacterium]
MTGTAAIVANARGAGLAVPAFNIPYLPMLEPVVRAVRDEDSFALIEVSRIEWEKFQSKSIEAVAEEYRKWDDPRHVRLHLDHVPVIDEDQQRVDFMPLIERAIACGYQSVMIDGSRLSLDENIRATKQVADRAHAAGIPCEAELGAVLGHEEGPMPPYEELFASGKGFTDPDEAVRMVQESGCDWLSVAFGNVHGAISKAQRDQRKIEARLNIEHLEVLAAATKVPLVLHGGSGIQPEYVRRAFAAGISKINVGTEIRQAYERRLQDSGKIPEAQEAVYQRTRELIRETYRLSGSRQALLGGAG